MFGRDRASTGPRVVAFDARGGVSPGAILTGVVVSFGATFVFSAIVGGVLVALGISNTPSAVVTAGVGAGIALIAALLLAYLWGGYAAGRMARGAGLANGVLVPLAAILVAIAVGAIVTALGATANLNLPSITHFNPRLPISSNQLNNKLLDTSQWIALGSLIAMFLGGAIGGLLGARWHTKLERRTLAERTAEAPVAATGATALQNERTAETPAVATGATVLQNERTGADDRSYADGDTNLQNDRTGTDDRSSTGSVEDRPRAETEPAENVSASRSAPPTTGGAVGTGSEYPPGTVHDQPPGSDTGTTTTGDSRA